MLLDIEDDRRSAKPTLPSDSRDVSNGLVIENWLFDGDGRPRCVTHGAMNRIDPEALLYRCYACGVGAQFVSETAAEKVRQSIDRLEKAWMGL